jgi:hypothetical protein
MSDDANVEKHLDFILSRRPEMPLPSARKLARNLAAALLRNACHGLAGRPIFATDEVIAARRQVCQNGCEFYRASDLRCAHPNCGCFLDGQLASKWSLSAERCPLQKWPP